MGRHRLRGRDLDTLERAASEMGLDPGRFGVVDVGMRVARLGRSSVRYEFGLFRQGDDPVCATGYFVDVFTDRESQQPVEIPPALRAHLQKLER